MVLNPACARCGFQLSSQMRFCPGCGAKLLVRRNGYLASGILGAVIVLAICIALQVVARDGRVKPAPHPSASARQNAAMQSGAMQSGAGVVAQSDPSELATLRAEVERNPEDLTKLKLLVGMLADRLRENPQASGELVFEAIDLLSRILHHEPSDPTALVTMADISFDQRAFSKSLSFYERYLKIAPDDLGARARYASNLTFLGRYDESVSELSKVLKSDPKNFPALAYLAITFAQKGDLTEARKNASIALALAPSEEARARFSGFVASLDRPGQGEAIKRAESSETGIAGFILSVKNNPVAGDKFSAFDGPKDGVLRLKFRNFPMAQMPPFAKQKFFDRLKEGLRVNGVDGLKALEFVDAESGAVLERYSLE